MAVQTEVKTLTQQLEEKDNLTAALEKQVWYSTIEAYEDISDAVKQWLIEHGFQKAADQLQEEMDQHLTAFEKNLKALSKIKKIKVVEKDE